MEAESVVPPIVERVSVAAREHLRLEGRILSAWAPGRVNLIGEHTDYNDGWVLPISIARMVCVSGQPHPEDGTIRLYSPRYGETVTFDVSAPPTADRNPDLALWARYVAGVIGELRAGGYAVSGFSAALDGDIPLGGGMSSSAALIVATLTWLDAAMSLDLEPLQLARIGQRAEHRGAGVRVGILDQAASVLGRQGHAMLIDCRSYTYQYIPFELADTSLLICDSGVSRSLAASGYNQRRAECEDGVRALAVALGRSGETRPVTALRDITREDYLRLGGEVPEPARHRVRHVLSENWRTLQAAETLQRHDAEAFGRLVLESHASLRDDYAVSCAELDAIVAIAMGVPGTLGARLVGAGFGGGVLIVARTRAVDVVQAALEHEYPDRTGYQPTIIAISPNGGPGAAWMEAAGPHVCGGGIPARDTPST
jgi:galactokinase